MISIQANSVRHDDTLGSRVIADDPGGRKHPRGIDKPRDGLGLPIVGTSANTHGLPAPVTAAHVALDLGPDVDLIVDGGRCPLGRPSTVIDVTRTPPALVRAGAVSLEAVQEALGQTLVQAVVALQR